MIIKKCLFNSRECFGERKEVDYEKPFVNWYWPKVYLCDVHKDSVFDYKDALNSRNNVKTNNAKMTHTKEFSQLQGMEYWIGNIEEINFCDTCHGTGEIGDCQGNVQLAQPCKACNCTGRK